MNNVTLSDERRIIFPFDLPKFSLRLLCLVVMLCFGRRSAAVTANEAGSIVRHCMTLAVIFPNVQMRPANVVQ